MPRFDERDTLFSRMMLISGSEKYRDYYQRRPDLETTDRAFREAVPGKYADRHIEQNFIDSTFSLIARLRTEVRGTVSEHRTEIDSISAGRRLKADARSLTAFSAGITETSPDFIYSIRGRGELYNRPVDDFLPFTLVMAFEMDRDEIMTAPDPRQSVEVVKTYLRAAIAALNAAQWIRSMGWSAVAHIDGESEVILPPAAAAAGLGEIGRHGLLVAPGKGSRIRLSAVTTDMPLIPDKPIEVHPGGLAAFCSTCGRCASLCPGKAIPLSGKLQANLLPSIDHEACFTIWKKFSTDCGICLAACPFSSAAE